MKKDRKYLFIYLLILYLTFFYLIISGCTLFENNYESVFLVYLDGANNLDQFAVKDLNEIFDSKIEKQSKSAVLVLIDRIQTSNNTYEDWFDTRLFEVKYEDNNAKISEIDCKQLGLTTLYIDEDLDMGNSNTLKNFVKFVKENYKADNYYLDIWNHGGGWRNYKSKVNSKEICTDDESESVMYMLDLRNALIEANLHFKAIFLDACFMGTIEVATNFLGLTDYIIFSQKPIPADGMPYYDLLKTLFSDNNIELRLKNICDAYVKFYLENNNQDISISCLKIDKQNSFDNFINHFLQELDNIDIIRLRQLRDSATIFSESAVDFSVFSECSDKIKTALSSILIYNYPQNLSGISIYFPKYFKYDQYYFEYKTESVYFCFKYPLYLQFLERYNHSGVENCDTYEPNGVRSRSFLMDPAVNIVSYIWFEEDIDFYKLHYIPDKNIKIKLTPPENHDYDIKVYYYINGDLKILQSALAGDLMEAIEIDSETAGKIDELYIVIFGANSDYSQQNPYTLFLEY